MVESLRQELKSALSGNFGNFQLTYDWMSELVPAQILMLKCQVLWCQGTEFALSDAKKDAMMLWKERHMSGISAQCSAIRECTIPLQRSKLSSILTIEVHHRNVLQRLETKKVDDCADFEWQICLRSYVMSDFLQCRFNQVNSTLIYSFEYWGVTSRLVVTALTEKCYITLTSALHLMLGGAPFGPAGTGKTETTKDLAKTVGRQCIVFNCGVLLFE